MKHISTFTAVGVWRTALAKSVPEGIAALPGNPPGERRETAVYNEIQFVMRYEQSLCGNSTVENARSTNSNRVCHGQTQIYVLELHAVRAGHRSQGAAGSIKERPWMSAVCVAVRISLCSEHSRLRSSGESSSQTSYIVFLITSNRAYVHLTFAGRLPPTSALISLAEPGQPRHFKLSDPIVVLLHLPPSPFPFFQSRPG